MKERSPLFQRSIFALLSAEVISSLGAQMTFLALPWFVLTTTGSTTRMGIVLAAELLAHRAARHSKRRRRFAPGSGEGDARLRSRTGATDAVDPPAAPGRPALVPASARARLRARVLHRAVLLRSAHRAAGARRRGLDDADAGERRRGGRFPPHDPPRARCRRVADRVDRRCQRPLRGRRDVRRVVLPPLLLRAEAARRCPLPPTAVACSPGCASSCATSCFGRCSRRRSSFTCSRSRSSSRCPSSRTSTTGPARARQGSCSARSEPAP